MLAPGHGEPSARTNDNSLALTAKLGGWRDPATGNVTKTRSPGVCTTLSYGCPTSTGLPRGHLVDSASIADMERQVVEPGTAPVVRTSAETLRLLDDEIGRAELPASAVGPVLEGLVAELLEQPSPFRRKRRNMA